MAEFSAAQIKSESASPKVFSASDIGGESPSYLSQVGTGLWNTVKGLAHVGSEAAGAAVDPLNAVEHLKNLKKMLLDPQVDQAIKAADEWKAGNRSESVGHALAAVLPGVGPAAANIGEKLGNQDYKGAAADATVLGATMVAPKVAGAVVRSAPAIADAAHGAGLAATETIPITRYGVDIGVPKPLVTAGAAAAGARLAGLPATPAAVIGAAAPIIRGAIKGGKAILAERAAALAPEEAAAATPGELLARQSGQDWSKLKPQDRQLLDKIAEGNRTLTERSATVEPSAPTAPPVEAVAPQVSPEQIPAVQPTAQPPEAPQSAPQEVPEVTPAPPQEPVQWSKMQFPEIVQKLREEGHQISDKPTADEMKTALYNEARRSGTLVDAEGNPVESGPDPTALADAARETPQMYRKTAAKANYRAVKEGKADPNTASPTYEAMNRAVKVHPVVQALLDNGVGYDDMAKLTKPEIESYVNQLSAATRGEHPGNVFSQLSIDELLGELRRAQK